MFSKPSTPTVDAFLKIAAAAGVSATWLLTGEEESPVTIPLLGTVTGESWTPSEDKALDLELRDFDLVGFRVSGDAMAPAYRDQDLLICQRRAGRNISNLIGQDCVVQTKDGTRYVKILQRGSRQNVYNLRSYNPTAKDVEDVVIDWAAPVMWIKRGGQS